MKDEMGWRVVVRDDDVTTVHLVAYVLHLVCELPLPAAVDLMWQVHTRGEAEVDRFAGRHEAERLVARLQGYGLHGMVRAA
ncbi:ATP-dependent Clp protease adaptor ClpS [Solihabitans fulvus]|uniref:ATP-dependent Clp protease adaptor ClpS n=1 Tax=Solihabitans fulvus TaxID=1892852 RepID=A0A5B2XFP1_9PSEU|nr:ATP-dependent Clp protease adaptor ClpS [Solihabitans fulvus]KAA2262597.1 ATP-dependent Clp protease adaptor ClpS [Solihabitans fulvus]